MSTELNLRVSTKAGREIVANLDASTYADILVTLGRPDDIQTDDAVPSNHFWQPGQDKPSLAQPGAVAVVQAMGRCATFRIAKGDPGVLPKGTILNLGALHPETCHWCDFPLEEVLAAVEYGAWESGYIVTEYAIWQGAFGSEYARSTPRQGTYRHPDWAAFFGNVPSRAEANAERGRLIAAAQGYDQAAMAAQAAPPRHEAEPEPAEATWFE